MVESPTIKVDRRGLAPAPGAGGMVEPPSPMSHAKILARHATFAPRSEEEKAFGCPIPSPSGGSAARAEGENEDPGRAGAAKAAAAASPRPAGRATVAASTPEKKEAAASPGARSMLLEPRGAADQRVTLVLDLDETLVRSSFDTNFDADFEAPFNLNGSWCTARVRKRPFVDNSPNAYLWHPEHAIDVVDFVGDPEDDELKTIADFLGVIHDVGGARQHARTGGAAGATSPPNARADAPNRAALAKEAKAAGN
ncbi:phosphoprotein phosphatase [Aureococcus anophagefferens]|nr:phosphoprotein phosphatase [Aureococcus anophagefferens]